MCSTTNVCYPRLYNLRYSADIPFDTVCSKPVAVPDNFPWNNGTPVKHKCESKDVMQSKAEWSFFKNPSTKFHGLTLGILANLNDNERVCPLAHPYERLQCSPNCIPCLIRNATQDTHELKTSTWFLAMSALIMQIYDTKELKQVS